MSVENCDDCKDFERELDHAKIQIQTLERLIESQKDQIEGFKEEMARGSEQALKLMVDFQMKSLEINNRLMILVEKLAMQRRD